MSLLTRTYTFSDGTTAYGSQVESEIANIVNTLNNLDSATTAWDIVKVVNASTTPLIADNGAGSNAIVDFRANGDRKISLNSVGALVANLAMNSNKLTGLAAGSAAGESLRFEQMKVVQYVIFTSTTNFSTTSASFQTTNLTAQITPSATSSKVLIIASACVKSDASGGVNATLTIAKGGSNILGTGGQQVSNAASSIGALTAPSTLVYVDSPASVAQLTYAVQLKSDGSTTCEYPGTANQTQFIILAELA